MTLHSHFLHRVHGPHTDPEFLHEERLYDERERAALRVMERHRDHLLDDIRIARSLADQAGIPWRRSAGPVEAPVLAVIGIGNRWRRDDGAGLEVARRLRESSPPGVEILEQEGEPAGLLEAFSHAHEALVIDGVSSGAPPGTLHRFEVRDRPLPVARPTRSASLTRSSSRASAAACRAASPSMASRARTSRWARA